MDRIVETQLDTAKLVEITRCEVDRYAGHSDQGGVYAILDDVRRTYAVVFVDKERGENSVAVIILARVVDEYIVIEADMTFDKPLVDALMVNGSVPRDKIILAYKGETLPTQTTE